MAISLNEFNFLNYQEFLITTGFLIVQIVSQYIQKILIIEELEFFFSILVLRIYNNRGLDTQGPPICGHNRMYWVIILKYYHGLCLGTQQYCCIHGFRIFEGFEVWFWRGSNRFEVLFCFIFKDLQLYSFLPRIHLKYAHF